MAKCSRENRRGADRQITVVVCGWIRLAPTGNPALPRRFRRRQDQSQRVRCNVRSFVSSVCVCAGSDDGDIL